MGSWKYKWRNWDRSHHNNRSMREQRGKFSTNWTSPANIMSGNLSLAKTTFLLDEQWVRGGGQAYEMAAKRTEYVVYENHIFVYTRTAGQKDMNLDSKQFFCMHVIKPGQFVRFLSFLFCYTPKWLPPTEGRISTDSQAENNDFWRSRRFKRKKSTKSDTTASRYYSSNTFAEEKVIVPSSVFQTWSLITNSSKVTF